ALPSIVSHDELPRERMRDDSHEDLCIGCDPCVVACRDGGHTAIDQLENRISHIDWKRCVGCGLCKFVCPVDGCIEIMEWK
ncbi:MAG: 4Fe-4S dicluster domain-containing protein, partial [Ignavibacteriae bacterium]